MFLRMAWAMPGLFSFLAFLFVFLYRRLLSKMLPFACILCVGIMDKSRSLLIIGAGQFGMVAKEAALAMSCFDKVDFVDDASPLAIGKVADLETLAADYSLAFIAIGNPEIRASLAEKIQAAGLTPATLIHPRAYVSLSATLAQGCIVEPMAVVNAAAQVGKFSFICAGAIVNHNAQVGEFCHIDCGALVKAREVIPPKTKIER